MAALSSALLLCMVVPWFFCLLFYTALHWTHARDRRRALRRGGEEDMPLAAMQVEPAVVRKRPEAGGRSLPAVL